MRQWAELSDTTTRGGYWPITSSQNPTCREQSDGFERREIRLGKKLEHAKKIEHLEAKYRERTEIRGISKGKEEILSRYRECKIFTPVDGENNSSGPSCAEARAKMMAESTPDLGEKSDDASETKDFGEKISDSDTFYVDVGMSIFE